MTGSSRKCRALVVGGSLAGLMAGLLLRRDGWDVDIYERVPDDMSGRGGGIATQDPMWASFARAGLDVAERPGVRIERRAVFGRDGAVLAERAIAETVSSWDTIYRLMLGAFPPERYHLGRGVASVEQDDAGVAAVLSDGARETADLLVAADGAGSTVRRALRPDVRSGYANYVAWRGLVDEADLPAIAREDLAGLWSFCVPPGEQMLSYTVPGPGGSTAKGERRHNFVWYQPAEPDRVLPDLLTDAEGEEHRPNIPPPAIRPAVIAAMRDHADAVLSPAYAAFVRATKQPFLQPVADHLSPRFCFGRAVLIGDAAAQARPHVGAGTSKAIADAEALAEALAAHDDVPAALAAYEAARLPQARRMVELGRWLGRGLDPAIADKGDGADQAYGTLIEVTARGLVDVAGGIDPPPRSAAARGKAGRHSALVAPGRGGVAARSRRLRLETGLLERGRRGAVALLLQLRRLGLGATVGFGLAREIGGGPARRFRRRLGVGLRLQPVRLAPVLRLEAGVE